MDLAPRRIGILGGTFNPIHLAHIAMAQGVLQALSLDNVLFIVASDPPHKQVDGHIRAAYRYAMVRLALQNETGLEASDIELSRTGKSYTVDTLEQLLTLYPGAKLFLIVGSDMLRDLPNWRRAQDLLRMAAFVGIPRKGQGGDEREAVERLHVEFAADVRLLDMDVPPISSTLVRERIARALPVTGLVPAAVEEYIYENGLYLPESLHMMQEKCRAALNKNRYEHTVGVVRTAITLAHQYGVDTGQARLAALLHDCGRSVEKGALMHAAAGERMARTEYGITDEAVLCAIRRHTTLCPGATKLDKVIYLADMIEPGRSYPGVEELRALARENLDAAVREGLFSTIRYVRENGQPVHPDSLLALRELDGGRQMQIQ